MRMLLPVSWMGSRLPRTAVEESASVGANANPALLAFIDEDA